MPKFTTEDRQAETQRDVQAYLREQQLAQEESYTILTALGDQLLRDLGASLDGLTDCPGGVLVDVNGFLPLT